MFTNVQKSLFFVLIFCFIGATALASNENTAQHKNIHSHQRSFMIAKVDTSMIRKLTKEEREWYSKFHNGNLLFSGWKKIRNEILQKLPQSERRKTGQLLEAMGLRIGAEWAKNNNVRKIDTNHLLNWGDRLRQAKRSDETDLYQTVKSISQEVDILLQAKK